VWLDVDVTGGTLWVPACASRPVAHKTRPPFAPVLGNEARSDHDSAAVLQSKAEEHAPRALVLHVTPMEDDRVSACDGTATIVLVCRIICSIILRLAHLSSMFRRISLFEHLFSCAGRSLAFASSRLDEYGYSVRSQTSGKVELCDHARSLRTPFTWN
jgi:hypothetical protein